MAVVPQRPDMGISILVEVMTTNPTEEWRAIKDSPGYQVSSLGSIRDPNRKILTPHRRNNGRLVVTQRNGNHYFQKYVHLAVLEAFVAPRERGFKAFFEDDDTMNCTLANLDWVLTDAAKQRPTTQQPTNVSRYFELPSAFSALTDDPHIVC